jgi:phosphoribosylformylglycinamidine cyclo-ligase
MKKLSYKKSGVDINAADEFVKGLKSIFTKSKINKMAAFGSSFDLKPLLKKYKDPILVSSTDGVGTKLKLAQQLNIHSGVGIDLVAMNVNDIVCLGAAPLFFLDYIACGKLNPKVLLQVVKGINNGLKQSNCLLLGGETAEMPGMYKPDEYDLAGFCVGIVDRRKMITGEKIKSGDLIIGLASSGLHSNGFSLARKAFNSKEIKKYSKDLLKPTRIYVKPILSLWAGKPRPYILSDSVKGIAHVTGGAFYSKATKILPKGYGMVIDKKKWKVPNIFKLIQEKGKISEKEMYSVFNMGIGMVVVVDKNQAKKVVNHLGKSCKAYIIGKIVKSNKKMVLA